MLKTRIATVGLSLALGLSMVAPASAVTVAELQAQINALMAQLSALQGSGMGTGANTSYTFSQNLTVGSTGGDVVSLQQYLVGRGHLNMPVGVSYGYFGSLTRAAVAAWQSANGVAPAVGYWGPLSRAKANSMVGAGATGTVPGTTVGGSVSVGVITTPGVEGSLTVSKYASPASGVKVREGATKVAVLGIKLEAKTSDIKVERIKLDLDKATGSDSDLYRKIAQKVYIMDGSTVIGSADLNTDTVVEDGTDRFITVSGMSYVVPKDSTKVLTVALDARSTWDSALDSASFSVGVASEGVRGIDGAGINQYGPTTGFSNDFTAEGELAGTATLTISTNSATPVDQEVICASGSDEDECDSLEVLRADFRAEKDAVTVTDLVVDIDMTGADTATATVAYLYEGSTLVGSETIDELTGTNSVTFADIDWTVAANTTKTLSVKIDVRDGQFAANIFTADIDTADVTDENSLGDSITTSGSAQGESITVRKAGLEITLLSKSITKTNAEFSGATSSLKADFRVRVKAVGAAVEFGDTGSTTYAFADNDSTLALGPSFVVYRGGTDVTSTLTAVASSTTMVNGSSLSAVGANSWSLGEGNTVEIDLSYVMNGKTSAGVDNTFGAYSVGLERINWLTLLGGRQSSTFMAGNSSWRTSTVTLP